MAEPSGSSSESNSGWSYAWQSVVSFLDAQVVGLERVAPIAAEDVLAVAENSFATFGIGVALTAAYSQEGVAGVFNEESPKLR